MLAHCAKIYLPILKKHLSRSRVKHSVGVAQLSLHFAQKLQCPTPEHAFIAGIYHDIAKEKSTQDLQTIAQQYGLLLGDEERNSPTTLHAPIGMLMVRHELGISHSRILKAIRWHTTGRARMSLLEKIVYVADIVDSGKKVEHALLIEKLATTDIDRAVWITARETLKHLLNKDRKICKQGLSCYNYYAIPDSISAQKFSSRP